MLKEQGNMKIKGSTACLVFCLCFWSCGYFRTWGRVDGQEGADGGTSRCPRPPTALGGLRWLLSLSQGSAPPARFSSFWKDTALCAHLPRHALGGSEIWCPSCHLPAGVPGHLVCASFSLSTKWESCGSQGFPGGSDSEESACNAGDLDSIPGLGRSCGGGHGNPLQYSDLKKLHGQRSPAGYSLWGHRVQHD